MKANFRLLRNLVLILPINAKMSTDSGIIITAIDKTAPQEGVVIAVGEGTEESPMHYKPGMRVIYSKSNIRDIKYEGDTLHVIPSSEILVVLTNDDS